MIDNPDQYIADFASAGADYISVQVEVCTHLHRTIHMIKENGVKAGAVLNPATALTTIDYVLEDLDFVLIMSVNPGFGGQSFIPGSLEKIRALRALIDQLGLPTMIQVDGGVNSGTIAQVSGAGADVFVAGSAIFNSGDYQQAIDVLKSKMEGLATVGSKKSMKRILVVHGPNLNTLGQRETEIYGKTSLADINDGMKKFGEQEGVSVTAFQSNHEGAIVDALQDAAGHIDGLIINPAAYTHSSIAIRDALQLLKVPIVEVHLSNIHRREPFRHQSMLADVATGQIVGLGVKGYQFALQAIIAWIDETG